MAPKGGECPVSITLQVIAGKWKPVILWRLIEGTHRFGQLKQAIPGVTQRMLTQQLRELERDGIVARKVYPVVPPRVEYSLTDFGHTLEPILGLMCRWGKAHQKQVAARRRKTDPGLSQAA